MRKQFLIALFTLIGGGLLISSCNKQEEATPKTTTQNAITKDAMASNIPWKKYKWAAMHKAGTDPAGIVGNYKGLDAVDLINELCANDPELIPQNGQFKRLFYCKFSTDSIISMSNNLFWHKRNYQLLLPDDYNEFYPYSFWAAYHPKIKQVVLAKLQELQIQHGNPGLKIRSVTFIGEDCHDLEGNDWSPMAGFTHALTGFYFGDWVE